MLIRSLANDWINPTEVAAIELFNDGKAYLYLKNGTKLTYTNTTNAAIGALVERLNAEERIHKELQT